jgi:hypothetical protein
VDDKLLHSENTVSLLQQEFGKYNTEYGKNQGEKWREVVRFNEDFA